MLMSNLLSIYITTYNRAAMLKKMIDSVFAQSYSDFNLYILDNASTDETSILVKSYRDPRINYIRHENNIGGLNNIKFAFKTCASKYIIVLHDDDIVCEDLIERELVILKEHPDIVAVSSNAYIIDENDKIIGNYKYDKNNEYLMYVNNYFDRYMSNGKTLIFPATMYNNYFLKNYDICINDKVGPCADVIFHTDIDRAGGKLVNINKELIKYRHHREQDSVINSVPMKVLLFKFLASDEYYSKKFLSKKKEQCNIFKDITKNIVQNYVAGNMNYDTAYRYISDISSCLNYNILDKTMYVLLIKIFNKFPKLIEKLMNVYKHIRR